MTPIPLTRATLENEGANAARPPVRIVHLGLGNFFRAHQAWYTVHASDGADWGIAAFTGRSSRIAEQLTRQDGLYTLIERGADGDHVEVITSLAEAAAGADSHRLSELIADSSIALVTLTITEGGYRLLPDGRPDLGDAAVLRDLASLRSGEEVETVLGRLLRALDARRRAQAGPIAVVPCDNIPGNGAYVATGVTGLATMVDPELAAWISENVSFVSTSVDRITPKVDEVPAAGDAGWSDAAPVVTEPFADWVLAGDFPAGRPDWESAGARFVDDIEPWEHRKLWLLNGAHSILAFAGLARGLETVAEAVADPTCRDLVEGFWGEAVQNLPEGTEHERYREQLLERFSNSRIVHRLQQIAGEATVKAQFRFAAVAERTLAAGRDPKGSIPALATWIRWVLAGSDGPDARADHVKAATESSDPVRALLELISPDLAASAAFVDRVRRAVAADPAPSTHRARTVATTEVRSTP